MNKLVSLSLLGIFILAYFLRVAFLPQNSLTFGYDQARDAYVTQQIVNGDLKILGPPSSTPGLFHGVFYYYFLAPSYFVGSGNPIIAAYWIAFFNALVVFIVFYLTYFMVKKIGTAFLAALLFGISFEATQYATWLSNPTIGIWTVPLIYLGLWAWINPSARSGRFRDWGPVVCAIGLGLSIQANIFLSYHIPPVLFWFWIARKNIKKSDLTKFLVFFLISISSMLLSEVKFGFKGVGGFMQLFISQDQIIASRSLGDFIVLYLNQLGKAFALSSYPGNLGYGGVFILSLILISIIYWKNKRNLISWQMFLAIWLLSHITVSSVGGTSTPFLLVGIGPAVSILLGIMLSKWWSESKKALVVVIFVIIVLGNLGKITLENPKGSTIFAIQKDMLLRRQLDAIDYTYQEARGEPFSISSLTSPLWINIVWTYLYKWYGDSRYGYIPEWHGRDQVGQLDSLPPNLPSTKLYYLILEPMGGIPVRYLGETIAEEDAVSIFQDEKYFGELRIQKRIKRD